MTLQDKIAAFTAARKAAETTLTALAVVDPAVAGDEALLDGEVVVDRSGAVAWAFVQGKIVKLLVKSFIN